MSSEGMQYYMRGTNFTVEVKHHITEVFGENNWAVYAIIPERHPLYSKLSPVILYYNQAAISAMPLHGGCTYAKLMAQKDLEECEPTSYYKIGCDYQHLYDERFRDLEPADVKQSPVWSDALALRDYLESFNKKEITNG